MFKALLHSDVNYHIMKYLPLADQLLNIYARSVPSICKALMHERIDKTADEDSLPLINFSEICPYRALLQNSKRTEDIDIKCIMMLRRIYTDAVNHFWVRFNTAEIVAETSYNKRMKVLKCLLINRKDTYKLYERFNAYLIPRAALVGVSYSIALSDWTSSISDKELDRRIRHANNESIVNCIFEHCRSDPKHDTMIIKLLLSHWTMDIEYDAYDNTRCGKSFCKAIRCIIARHKKQPMNLDKTYWEGMTLLMIAIRYDYYDSANLLLDNGANIEAISHTDENVYVVHTVLGMIILSIASSLENLGLISVLCSKGANPNRHSEKKNHPLIFAGVLVKNRYELAEELLKCGSNPNTICFFFHKWRYTPFHDALMSSDLKMAELMLQYGANPNINMINNKKIRTSLQLVKRSRLNPDDYIKLIEKYGYIA